MLGISHWTFFYLFLPYLIFYAGWLSPFFFIPGLIFAFTTLRSTNSPKILWNKEILFCAFILVFWAFASGNGTPVYQNGDHVKHNAILSDLTTSTWPLVYQYFSYQSPMIYYFAHYLPPAAFAKFFGTQYLQSIQFLWSYLGVLLAFFWLTVLTKKRGLPCLLMFIFFSGLDYIGNFFIKNNFPFGIGHVEWWAKHWQFSSNTTLFYWVPQHAIPAWLLTSILYYEIFLKKKSLILLSIFSLSYLWSPFVSIGLTPLLIWGLRKNSSFTKENLLFLFHTPIFYFYYSSRYSETTSFWFIQKFSFGQFLPLLTIFIFLEFFIYFLCIRKYVNRPSQFIILFPLLILPFYKFGHFNDLCMRASIPSLFFLQINLLKYFPKKLFPKVVLISLLTIGSLTAVNEIRRTLEYPFYYRNPWVKLESIGHYYFRQYLGHSQGIFFKYLSKKYNVARKLDVR